VAETIGFADIAMNDRTVTPGPVIPNYQDHSSLAARDGMIAGHRLRRNEMELTVESCATDDDIRAYTSGESHVLAVALHRAFGWGMLVITDAPDPYWVDPGNGENQIGAAVHVYAIDDAGDLWDIRGRRPKSGYPSEMYVLFNVQDFEEDLCADEAELKTYVGFWSEGTDPVERPLSSYGDDDIKAAEDIITRVFPTLPYVPPLSQVFTRT
jgi:hypothetical protein